MHVARIPTPIPYSSTPILHIWTGVMDLLFPDSLFQYLQNDTHIIHVYFPQRPITRPLQKGVVRADGDTV